jgi:vancomycin resistance protein VanJ
VKRIAGIIPWLARAAALLLVTGLFTRASGLRDSVRGLALIFYATPWPVLTVLAFLLAAYALGRNHRARALALTLVFAGCAATWLQRSLVRTEPAPAGNTLRVVYWNAAHPGPLRAERVRYLQTLRADLIAVGESNVYTSDIPREWRDGFPGCTLTQRAGFLLITPEDPVTIEKGRLADRGDYVIARVMVKDRALTLLLVDFEIRLRENRAQPFARLNELIAAHRDEPLIVMGDFNTPRESLNFDSWRPEMREAFVTGGRGFVETWPVPLPVLSLDQMWLGGQWRAVHCELGWSLQSDHRAVIADLAAP